MDERRELPEKVELYTDRELAEEIEFFVNAAGSDPSFWKALSLLAEEKARRLRRGTFDVAVVFSVNAPSYEEALRIASMVVEEEIPELLGVQMEVVDNYEHDNEGQRVLYLHSEREPVAL